MAEVVHQSFQSCLVSLQLKFPFPPHEDLVEADEERKGQEEKSERAEENVKQDVFVIYLAFHPGSRVFFASFFLFAGGQVLGCAARRIRGK